jgi:hypothetical protein
MAKMTKVFGAIFCVLGTIYLIVSTFLYLNTSAHLDYNSGKQMSFIQSGMPYFFIVSILILGFGIILAKDKIIDNDHH